MAKEALASALKARRQSSVVSLAAVRSINRTALSIL
jgi:hypothetical protein